MAEDSAMTGGPYPLSRAVLAELQAELAAGGVSMLDLAKRLPMDYNTLRRHIIGERPMPVSELFDVLAALQLDPVDFIARSQQRAARTR